MAIQSHHDKVNQQFSSQANAYLSSSVHASGRDLERLSARLGDFQNAAVLDMGCGAGHASFIAAAKVKNVVAYDLSSQMLALVAETAQTRGITNLTTSLGYAEALPFDEETFDVVISRYSAHHWHDVGQALREVKRVLKPGGTVIFMDVLSPGYPVLDIWLQTIEALRDTSHVRNYASGEWLRLFNDAGLMIRHVNCDKLNLEFTSWIARMRTPIVLADAIRAYQKSASDEVKRYYDLQRDGSFTSDTIMLEASKV
ncbi:class I SAM-dependent methyltransferase [uncultured Cedecea sp.]|uniref:class I SAM-dependent methyltransferase n=1 Tax=uncultured Cedecea sp. TaxID=988762 RepID=UPI0026120EC3|nr:class I SAM-dependent methyltransferase [uncultured Cedecea sp.]